MSILPRTGSEITFSLRFSHCDAVSNWVLVYGRFWDFVLIVSLTMISYKGIHNRCYIINHCLLLITKCTLVLSISRIHWGQSGESMMEIIFNSFFSEPSLENSEWQYWFSNYYVRLIFLQVLYRLKAGSKE